MAAAGSAVKTILDRPLVLKPQKEVSLSAFAFLFSEMVQYTQERSQSVDDMTARLEKAGHGIGFKACTIHVEEQRFNIELTATVLLGLGASELAGEDGQG